MVRARKGIYRWGGDFTKRDPVHIDNGLNVFLPKIYSAKLQHFGVSRCPDGNAHAREHVLGVACLFKSQMKSPGPANRKNSGSFPPGRYPSS
jgi:hypothetical protein